MKNGIKTYVLGNLCKRGSLFLDWVTCLTFEKVFVFYYTIGEFYPGKEVDFCGE